MSTETDTELPSAAPEPVPAYLEPYDYPDLAVQRARAEEQDKAGYIRWDAEARARVFGREQPEEETAAETAADAPEPPAGEREPASHRGQKRGLFRRAKPAEPEAVTCDECGYPLRPCPQCGEETGHDGYDDHQCGPPAAEEVMPDGPGETRADTSLPRPGQEAEREAPRSSITGPGPQDARLETAEGEGRALHGLNNAQPEPPRPEARPHTMPDLPGPGRSEPADDDLADVDAAHFGAPDEPFWGAEKPRVAPPPEPAEETAVPDAPKEDR